MGEPIRILHVFGRLNCGGAENMLMNIYRCIDRNKIQFDFIIHTQQHCYFTDEIKELGGRIYSAPRYNVKNHFIYKKWWNNFLKQHPEYKIIHGHMYSIASIYLKIAKKYGLITISHGHTSSAKSGFTGVVKRIIQLPLRNTADWLFACSDKAGEWLYGKDCKARKNFVLLKNAIDTEKYAYDQRIAQKIRKEFNLQGKFVIGHVGRFFAPKNHMYLLEIFKDILEKNKDAVLLLVGDGELRAQIEDKIRELNIKENVILTGVRSDVNELFQAMDCFVFPSLYEGVPVTVIEAQAAGLPCFISDVITEEVCITGLVKMFSTSAEPKIWSEEILRTYKEYKRENTRQEIMQAGYDICTTVEWISEFYLNCIE